MIGGGMKSAEEWRDVPGKYVRIPKGAVEAAAEIIEQERQVYAP